MSGRLRRVIENFIQLSSGILHTSAAGMLACTGTLKLEPTAERPGRLLVGGLLQEGVSFGDISLGGVLLD